MSLVEFSDNLGHIGVDLPRPLLKVCLYTQMITNVRDTVFLLAGNI